MLPFLNCKEINAVQQYAKLQINKILGVNQNLKSQTLENRGSVTSAILDIII